MIVSADADMAPPSHYVEVFELLDGGQRDGGWMGEGRPEGGHALAILPGLTHYDLGARRSSRRSRSTSGRPARLTPAAGRPAEPNPRRRASCRHETNHPPSFSSTWPSWPPSCARFAPAQPRPPTRRPAPSLDGKTFLSTDLHWCGPRPRDRASPSAFQKGGEARARTAGATRWAARTRSTGDHVPAAAELFTTEMACEAPLMKQDQWLLASCSRAPPSDSSAIPSRSMTGSVRLTLLDRKVASPDKPIEGTRWVLDGIVTGDAVSSVPTGVTAAMRIVDGKLELEAGCNTGGGSCTVTADDDRVRSDRPDQDGLCGPAQSLKSRKRRADDPRMARSTTPSRLMSSPSMVATPD